MTIFRCKGNRARMGYVVGVVALAACQRADPSICKSLYDPSAVSSFPTTTKNEFKNAHGCVRDQAYRMSDAEGSVSDVANAAVAACSDDIELYVLQAAQDKLIKEFEVDVQLENERKSFADLGRSYVVQARAGNCEGS